MKILLLAPVYMDLYKDVITELEIQGHIVEYLEDFSLKNDPCMIRNKSIDEHAELLFGSKLEKMWIEKIESIKESYFDLLFVINGKSFHPYLRRHFLGNNPKMKSVLYLWDRTYNNYRFDKYIKEFDDVLTFDKEDAMHFGIRFLPFYWIEPDIHLDKNIDVFGFGTMRYDRYILYRALIQAVSKFSDCYFIKLYQQVGKTPILSYIKRLIKNKFNHIDNNMITNSPLTPNEFRKLIQRSKCVIDTHNEFQEGLTPRFIWALGAQCKIITTNINVKTYPFYSPDFIYVIDDLNSVNIPIRFFENNFKYPEYIIKEITNLRIDNWIKCILSNINN